MKNNSFKTPFFSLIIVSSPGRRREIINCLNSILKSTYKSFEVRVIDNSCDSFLSKEIPKNYPMVLYINMKSNTGIRGFNVGFALSKGKYILALDDDASILPKTLEIIQKKIKSYPSNIGVIGCNSYNPDTQTFYHRNYLHNRFVNLYNQTIGGTVFKKEIFAKSGYFDENFFCWMHEDDLFIRIRNAGYKTVFDKHIIIHHQDHWSKIRKEMFFFMFRNYIWICFKYFSFQFIPILLIRNIVTLFALPLKKHSLTPLIWGMIGYLSGICTLFVILPKRKVVSMEIQKEYVNYYVFNIFAS